MNYLEAQKQLVDSIKSALTTVNSYFWRLSGDEPNSLCRFLCMEEEELKVILRLCKIYNIYNGDKDDFSKNNFKTLMEQNVLEIGPRNNDDNNNDNNNNNNQLKWQHEQQ